MVSFEGNPNLLGNMPLPFSLFASTLKIPFYAMTAAGCFFEVKSAKNQV